MAEPLRKLFMLPGPKRAILLGKGPSLDAWNPAEYEGEFVLGINEAAQRFRCNYGIYIDERMEVLDLSKTVPLRPKKYKDHHGGRGYWFHDEARQGFRPDTPKYTACRALDLLDMWGAQEILMVGFDGFDSKEGPVYASSVQDGLIRERPDADYSSINRGIWKLQRRRKLNLRWFHRGERFSSENPVDSADYYREVYDRVYKARPRYGCFGHGIPYTKMVMALLPKGGTLVDVGAGRHVFSSKLIGKRPDATVYDVDVIDVGDPSEGAICLQYPAWDLSGVTKEIDVLTSFDMLEHLKECDVNRTLHEWGKRVKGAIVCTVAHSPAKVKDPGGESLHLTVRPREWWAGKLADYFRDVRVSSKSFAVDGRTGCVRAGGTCFVALAKDGTFDYPEEVEQLISPRPGSGQPPVVVSFYTKGSSYEELVGPFTESCRHLGLQTDITEVKSAGSWANNCCIKPQIILDALRRYFPRTIIWSDIDSVFRQRPILAWSFPGDVGNRVFSTGSRSETAIARKILKRNNRRGQNATVRRSPRHGAQPSRLNVKVFAGTMILRPTNATFDLLERWVKAASEREKGSSLHDQDLLQPIIGKMVMDNEISFVELPASYSVIDGESASEGDEIVIEHFQASRRFRQEVTRV